MENGEAGHATWAEVLSIHLVIGTNDLVFTLIIGAGPRSIGTRTKGRH